MDKKPEIMVYFNCGSRARFPADKTVLLENPTTEEAGTLVMNGYNIVNWANVSFIRRFEEREEEE